MKETAFINKNKVKWGRFEKLSNDKNTNPEELSELFTEVNEDLSYAQTFYERRTVRAYLNQAAQGVYRKLYKQKGESLKKYWESWSVIIPIELYKSRKNLLFALVMFLLWTVVGAITTHYYPEFIDLAAGPGMVERTNEYIDKGDPFGFYGDTGQTSMFFAITLNNITVAFYCFLGGLLFSFGTHVMVFRNAMMLGAFQYIYILKGIGLSSFLAIWIHGAFEISAIIIASGAGFTIGHSLLFPGSYSRIQSFQMGAKRGMRIMLALVPVFIIAGFLESFVTRNYDVLPDWSKWCIILFSFLLILFYFVVYPQILARKHPELLKEKESVNPLPKIDVKRYKIRTSSELISDTFHFYRSKFSHIMKVNFSLTLPLALLIAAGQFYLHLDDMAYEYPVDWSAQLGYIFGNPFSENVTIKDTLALFLWILPLSLISASVLFNFKVDFERFSWQQFFDFYRKNAASLLVGTALFYLCIILLPTYLLIPMIFFYPLLLNLISFLVLHDGEKSFYKALSYGAKNWSYNLLIIIFFIAAFTLFAQPIAFYFSSERTLAFHLPDLLDVLCDFVKIIFNDETAYTIEISNAIRIVVYLVFILICFPLFVISSALSSYKVIEQSEAIGLRKEFENFGKHSRTQENHLDYE